MTEPKFTPGPWEWIGKNSLWGRERATVDILSASDDSQPYCLPQPIIEHHWNEETAEANRNLIAAAPYLYSLLEGVSKFLENNICLEQPFLDSPPEPASQFEYEAGLIVGEIQLLLAKARGE